MRIGVFAFKRFCKILIQIIEINIFQTSLSQQFERLVVFLKSRKNGFYRFYMVAFTSRIKTLSENKLFRIVFKVIKYNVFFAFEIAIKRSPAHAGFFRNVGYAYFFIDVIAHQLKKSLYDIVFCVFFGGVFHDTKSPILSQKRGHFLACGNVR